MSKRKGFAEIAAGSGQCDGRYITVHQLDQRSAKEVTEADTEGGHGQTGHVLVRPQGNGQETVQQSHQQGTQQTTKHRNRNSEESVHICRTACRSLIEEGADDTADTSHIHNAGDSQIQVTGFLRDDLTGTSI